MRRARRTHGDIETETEREGGRERDRPEKARRTHGNHGAGKLKSPKKFIGNVSFLRPQTYTIMKVSEYPRNST